MCFFCRLSCYDAKQISDVSDNKVLWSCNNLMLAHVGTWWRATGRLKQASSCGALCRTWMTQGIRGSSPNLSLPDHLWSTLMTLLVWWKFTNYELPSKKPKQRSSTMFAVYWHFIYGWELNQQPSDHGMNVLPPWQPLNFTDQHEAL